MADTGAVLGAALGERHFDFSDADFARVRSMIHRRAGIALGTHKREMVYSRLARRLRARELPGFGPYLAELDADERAAEWEMFVNALTTNLTAFFREAHHFPMLADYARRLNRPMQVWCNAASTGEEPYSIAITLIDALGPRLGDTQVLATDIDTNVLQRARGAVYPFERVEKVAPDLLRRHFLKGRGKMEGMVRVRPHVAARVRFEALNLLDRHWPLREPVDAIFCRNVMIYFDKPTQAEILRRMAPLLKPGGLLFAGHSENFTYLTKAFRLKGQTVYERVADSA
ncbi:MAG: chemotaxis protein CheR [Pigmentiphaga sp.]|nr:chemotaxis protein CheR [Pigmentiphaga sp.]